MPPLYVGWSKPAAAHLHAFNMRDCVILFCGLFVVFALDASASFQEVKILALALYLGIPIMSNNNIEKQFPSPPRRFISYSHPLLLLLFPTSNVSGSED